ncbi:MAG: serine protease [Tissierellia bacterium]|nr:serine protease [Tissierellia bacterium]
MGHAQNINYNDNTYYTAYNNQSNGRGYFINYNNSPINYLTNLFNNIIIRFIPSSPSKPVADAKPGNPVPDTKPNNPVPDTKPSNPVPDTKPNNPVPDTKPSNPVPDTNTGTNTSIEMEVVRLVNIERQKAGLAPFSYSGELSKVARAKSQDMANNNYFSHNSPTYGDPFAMMRSFGIQYRTAGENIAKGYSSAQSVVNGWMNSPGHRANILNSSFGKIGVGYVNAKGTTYWTQMFTD